MIDCLDEEDDFETFAAYLIAFVCGTDEDSRQAYVEKELEWAVNSSEEAGEEIFDRTVETISMRDPVVTFDVDLEAGSYWGEAEGGIARILLDDPDTPCRPLATQQVAEIESGRAGTCDQHSFFKRHR